MAEGLVAMWIADALGDMADALMVEAPDKHKTVLAEGERSAVDGRPVVRLRLRDGETAAAVRVEIAEERGADR